MRQKPMLVKEPADHVVKDIRRATRRNRHPYSFHCDARPLPLNFSRKTLLPAGSES